MKRISLLASIVVGAACGTDDPGRLPLTGEPVRVSVSTELRAPSLETYPATIQSERSAEIATRMSGTVIRVPVDVGTHVLAGETVIELDATDVTARVSAALGQLHLAERTFRRMENLAADGAVSPQELDQATATLESARARLLEAQAQEAYAVVRAPFDGVVTARTVDPGDLALPGMPLLTIIAPNALKVVAELPAHRSGELTTGASVDVQVAGHEGTLLARLTRIVPALESGSRTFRVEATPVGAWSGVIPGAYARVILTSGGRGPRWLPADAIIKRGQLTGVYALEGDTIRLRWVRVGQRRAGAVELLSGPEGFLTVVRNPATDLFDGRAVAQATLVEWVVPGNPAGEEMDR